MFNQTTTKLIWQSIKTQRSIQTKPAVQVFFFGCYMYDFNQSTNVSKADQTGSATEKICICGALYLLENGCLLFSHLPIIHMFTYNNKHSEQGGNKLSPKSVSGLQGLYKVAPRHKISFTIITLPILNSIYVALL